MPYKDPEKQRKAVREAAVRFRQKHPGLVEQRAREWRLRNPGFQARKRHADLQFRLKDNMRRRLRLAVAGNYKSGSAIESLGCTIDQLKSWLMYQFQPGMTWENYGKWHIDHVLPVSHFDLSDLEQLKKACNWYNLQPLWAKDNARKGNKVGPPA